MPLLLVVEDNMLMRKTLVNIFNANIPGVRVHEAVNGKEALAALEDTRPFIVLMDIELPDSSGLDLTRRIKTRAPEVKVLVFSLYDTLEYREAAARNGADGFFSKRTDSFDELVEVIREMTEIRSGGRL
ncbi:MAG: response regulator transcription factor [Desulfobacteraceae bacterium]